MHSYKKIIIFTCSLALLFIGKHLESYTTNQTQPKAIQPEPVDSRLVLLESEYRHLQIELSKLKNPHIPVASITTNDSQKSNIAEIDNSEKSIKAEKREKHAKTVLAEIEKLKYNYQNDTQYDVNQARNIAFENEPINSNWAKYREEKLREAFQNEKLLQNKSVKSITCHSKHCRIQIFYHHKDEMDNFTSELRESLMGKYDDIIIPFGTMGYFEKEKTANIYLTDDPDASLL